MRTKLRDGERKILETRTHWITNLTPFLYLLLTGSLLVSSFFELPVSVSLKPVLRWGCAGLFSLAVVYVLFREWYRRRDIWAVTNFRVVDEKGLLRLFSKESPLEKINNLSYSQSILGRVLNYGDVEIQTAAEDGATIYHKVKGPKTLKDTIARCRDEYGHEIQTLHAAAAAAKAFEETRVCPFCAETVKARAKVCRYCGRDLPPLPPFSS
jgi:uncharacterized membrane protein YdbT with pleckstrin-like domain